jgi:hypothetical protein
MRILKEVVGMSGISKLYHVLVRHMINYHGHLSNEVPIKTGSSILGHLSLKITKFVLDN